YLVYCPTCSCEMSVNANVCPRCGETQFHLLKDVPSGQYEESSKCGSCTGGYHTVNKSGGSMKGAGYLPSAFTKKACSVCHGSGKNPLAGRIVTMYKKKSVDIRKRVIQS
ncbi:hypothetical protein, partial [Pseudoalteromonas sp. SG45-1]|uniref:hypothetical protein n=1 Tax=Pseudoalteromonas sp. SG45-1 TaxID=2760957 RepID=UPI001C7205F2